MKLTETDNEKEKGPEQVGGWQGWGMGGWGVEEMGEGSQKVQTSSYEISKF